MERNIDMNEISNGKKYQRDDLVRIGCNDCKGCSYCCESMGDTIFLDPYDIFNLCKGLSLSFDALCDKFIDFTVVDGIVQPHIKLSGEKNACGFLSDAGRCTIHSFRPGFCRLFPLGRIYENDSFAYFIQTHECPYPSKSKVKIKSWLGIDNLPEYERYINSWHYFLKDMQGVLKESDDEDMARNMSLVIIRFFYRRPYDISQDFYSQFYNRLESFKNLLGI